MTKDHIDQSIARALKGESHLDPDVLKIHGFSTPPMRHLFNNLCHVEGLVYCEVGCFCGASLIAAFNNNPILAIGIDDFSQDFSQKNVREQLKDNVHKWSGDGSGGRTLVFDECDCFRWATYHSPSRTPEAPPVRPIDVFTYDGRHDVEPTARALPAFYELLSDTFLFIVDDFHWKTVSAGVQQGFDALAGRFKLIEQWQLSGNKAQDDAIWWNGLALFLCEKT